MKNKLRVGVVGMGHRGRELMKISAEFDCVIPAAACDLKPSNWYETQWLSNMPMAEMFPEAEFYESYDEMLDKANLDIVIVETGADIHAEFCVKALYKHINVLTDIPLVANLKEAEMIWKAAQEIDDAIICTGANPNWSRFSVLLKDFYDKGLLGKPYYMDAEYIHPIFPGNEEEVHLYENGNWRTLLSPIRYCTHSLGPLLRIVDEELRWVSCFGTGLQANPEDYDQTAHPDDMQAAQFQTDSGLVIRLLRNGRCRARCGHHNRRVFGTEGFIERMDKPDAPCGRVIRYNSMKELDTSLKEVRGDDTPPAYENNPKATGHHDGVDYAMLDSFYKAVLNGDPAPVNVREGLAMTLPGIYAEESSKRGGEVLRMRYPWDEDWTTEI